MILDKLENASQYFSISPNLTYALQYLLDHKDELSSQPLGITKLTDSVQIKYLTYETMPYPRRWESHLEFTDLQYMIRGDERMGYSHIGRLADPVKQEGKDQIIYQGDGEKFLVPEGHFVVFFPQDAHMSKLHVDGQTPGSVQKAAFKIRL